MASGTVVVVDRVLLQADDAFGWLDRLRAEYAPGAERRGMRLADAVWAYSGPDAVEMTVRWELPDVASFWSMRWAAQKDEAVATWWEATDAMALHRDRTVCSST